MSLSLLVNINNPTKSFLYETKDKIVYNNNLETDSDWLQKKTLSLTVASGDVTLR